MARTLSPAPEEPHVLRHVEQRQRARAQRLPRLPAPLSCLPVSLHGPAPLLGSRATGPSGGGVTEEDSDGGRGGTPEQLEQELLALDYRRRIPLLVKVQALTMWQAWRGTLGDLALLHNSHVVYMLSLPVHLWKTLPTGGRQEPPREDGRKDRAEDTEEDGPGPGPGEEPQP